MINIAVRLDDITPDMDWKRFFDFKELLDQHGIKPLIGVVPDNLDENLFGDRADCEHPEFWNYIKQLQEEGWIIAMHGYRHIYSTSKGGLFPLNSFSEFAGLTYEQQFKMLQTGKQILQDHGLETDLFMAPAHSYDKNTLLALKETGFRGITDGFGKLPYLWHGLIFYPISFRIKSTLQKKKGYSTLVVHTGTMAESDRIRYAGYFGESTVHWIPYSEYLNTPPNKRTIAGRLTELLLASGKAMITRFTGCLKK